MKNLANLENLIKIVVQTKSEAIQNKSNKITNNKILKK